MLSLVASALLGVPPEGGSTVLQPGSGGNFSQSTNSSNKLQLGLCSMFTLRYEAPHLLPWIAHNLHVGVGHIFLFMDDISPAWASDDLQKQLASTLHGDDRITLLSMKHELTSLNLTVEDAKMQHGFGLQALQIQRCNSLGRERVEWMGSWDLDEYPVIGHAKFGDEQPKTLAELTRAMPEQAKAITLPRFNIGAKDVPFLPSDNGAFETETFTHRMPNDPSDPKVKTIWKTDAAHLSADVYYAALNLDLDPKDAEASFLYPDGSSAPFERAQDGTWKASALPNENDERPDIFNIARLYHVVKRSVSECNWKVACRTLEINHKDEGWRAAKAANQTTDDGWCSKGAHEDAQEDIAVAKTAEKTRAFMKENFGWEAIELQKALAVQFRIRMDTETEGGKKHATWWKASHDGSVSSIGASGQR